MGIVVILILIVILGAVVAAAMVAADRRRTRALRAGFGPEYDRMVAEHGSQAAADAEAKRRLRAHSDLDLQTLSEEDKQYYTESWDHVRGDFVDHPATSVIGADRLVRTLLHDVGYRGEPEEQLALASVPHGTALAGYRDAREVVAEVEQDSSDVPTERMRVAVAACGRLVEELLGVRPAGDVERRQQQDVADAARAA